MALYSLGPVLFSTNPEDQIDFLKSKGLLRTQQDCPSCGILIADESEDEIPRFTPEID